VSGAGISQPEQWPDALAHLRARHAAGGRVDYIGGPGDSITEGTGATSRENTWWSRFSDAMLNHLGQPTRAIGSTEVTLQSCWSVWSHAGPPPIEGTFCLGQYGVVLQAGTVLSTTRAFDRVQLLHVRLTEMLGSRGGTLEVRIDGTVVDRVRCGGADVFGSLWDSGPLGEFRPRRIELECVSDGVAPVGHAYFHDGFDPDRSVLFWRHGRHRRDIGTDEFGFANPRSTHMGPFTAGPLGRNDATGGVISGGGSIGADCFLISCGTNDVERFGNDRRVLEGTYSTMIDFLRSRCDTDASIGVIVPTASTKADGDYTNLFEAAHAACRAEGAFLIDLWHGLGSHADDSFGYLHDGLHPNDRGHAAWAEYVAAWLQAAIGSVTPTDAASMGTGSAGTPTGSAGTPGRHSLPPAGVPARVVDRPSSTDDSRQR
jgi:lysophospholipase L1-like esterase